MRPKVYVVELSDDEREELRQLLRGGVASTRKLTRARILLLAHEGKGDAEIVDALQTSMSTVGGIRKRFVEDGVHGALNEVTRPGGACTLDGNQEAYLVALACSTPPAGRSTWTMQLLADRLVTVGITKQISDETVRRVLKRGASSRGNTSNGASLQ